MRPMWMGTACTGALVALSLACSGDSATAPGRAVALSVVSGDQQTAAPSAELANPLVVRVTDANGQPVQGQIVNFRVTAGGGAMFAGAGSTNAQGIVQDRWTLGPTAGPQTAEARAVDNTTGAAIVFATFTATARANPGPPTLGRLRPVSGDGQVATVGSHLPQPVVFLATDTTGAPLPNYTFTLRSLIFHSSNGDYCTAYPGFPGDDQLVDPTLTTGPDGTATYTGWTLGTHSGIKCVGLYPGISQSQHGDDVGVWQVGAYALPGPPTQLVKRSQDDDQHVPAGTTLLMRITVEDQYGNGIVCSRCPDPQAHEIAVTFSPSAGGQVSTAQTMTSGAEAYTYWTIATGVNTLTISAGSLSVTYTATGT